MMSKFETSDFLRDCQACLNEDDAKQREIYLKSGMGKKYIRNRLRRYLENL
jgi:putative endonuclease